MALTRTKSRNVWGILYPIDIDIKVVGLINDEYTVGRDECDILIPISHVDVSRKHFSISRIDNSVFLEDSSTFGTYINGVRSAKGRRAALKHNDRISFVKPDSKGFVFMDKALRDSMNFPRDIKAKYAISRVLGKGTFGIVHLVFERKTSRRFAMKAVRKTENVKYIHAEIRILKELQHPCVVQLEMLQENEKMVYIVLELMEGGDLYGMLCPKNYLKEEHAKLMFYQVVLAVQYLHQRSITHRDLKPQNILLASRRPETLYKVADFGVSKNEEEQSVLKTYIGTLHFMAPEVLAPCSSYTKQVDIWSLGVILYFSLSTCYPFKDAAAIERGEYGFPERKWQTITQPAKELIKSLLIKNPNERITVDEILTSEWLREDVIKDKFRELQEMFSR